jgi:hypothetical protein
MDVREILDYRASPTFGSLRVRQYNFTIEGLGITFQNQLQRACFFDNGTLRYWAVRLIAGTDVTIGDVLALDQGTPDRVIRCPTAGNLRQMPCGVSTETNFGGRWVFVAVSGIALVRPEAAITAAAGNLAYTSVTVAGRVQQSAAVPAGVPDHNSEVGHFVTTGAGAGIATPCMLHFN